MVQKKTKTLVTGAIIAALYVVLTLLANAFGLASGVIQVRISEALNVLVCFTGAAVPGVTVGCLLANLLTGGVVLDIIFGTLASFIGAFGGYLLRKNRLLALLCPILSNTIIVPFVLKFAYGAPDAIWFLFGSVAVGEVISCGILGFLLGHVLDRYGKNRLFHK
ncbi:MAG: QueT transporter family protein [Eubacteriales bacterium]|jgi:uncharacterized membrane protein